jgi:gliding motility-associated-like protein
MGELRVTKRIFRKNYCLPGWFKNIMLFLGVTMLSKADTGQCIKDSNYYSITYTAPSTGYITDAIITSQNETVVLGQLSSYNNFIAKFTSSGNIIWSNEYTDGYPYTSLLQPSWYQWTRLTGMIIGNDSSYYVYGSSYEHGRTLNNVEDPPAHWIGLIMNIDKHGNVISGRYVGNWRTDYTISSMLQLINGNLLIYLRSQSYPFISKIVCINKDGNVVWGTPLKPYHLYSELNDVTPVMRQRANGNIVIGGGMLRNLDDTLIYPFMPPIIFKAPLYYFNLFELDVNNGKLQWQASYQCPTNNVYQYPDATNTTIPADFIPRIKTITELPNGNLSFCADMYVPADDQAFWRHKDFTRRTVNLVTSEYGGFLKLFSYYPLNGSCSIENGWKTGNGEQVLLSKDSATQQLLMYYLDNNAQVVWSRSYTNAISATNSLGYMLQKQNNKGYSIFQSDPSSGAGSLQFHLNITNSLGNNPCSELPITMDRKDETWPWYMNKIYFYEGVPFDQDFRYSPFDFTKKTYPISQHIDCQYQYECCKDFIDSLHPHNISLCENQSYTLPDNSNVKDSGVYYTTFKTGQGCDSIVFYNIKIIKSPSHLTASPDTCLESATTIRLKATGGYEGYLWNSFATPDSFYLVHSPGNYTVTVENICGAKTDTVHVYDQCIFPVYFPTAFTPNGDFLNDVLRVPWANKNKLRRLSIYNRWGELVFTTTTPGAGWDGKYKGLPQATGVYIYFLEMESLTGQKLEQKGTVTLIR